MEQYCNKLNKGCVSATSIKLFAVVCMTIDHLGAYGPAIPGINGYYSILRAIGRMAAPLFLYFAMDSMKHTRSQLRFFLRIYLAAVFTGVLNYLISTGLDIPVRFGNIFHSFAWTIGTVILINMLMTARKNRNYFKMLIYAICGALIVIAVFVFERVCNEGILHTVVKLFLLDPWRMEYSISFLLLGVTWYKLNRKWAQCAVLFFYCIISFLFGMSMPEQSMLADGQWTMLGAIPIIMLYNGSRGKGLKYFFYIYYPVHMYAISLINLLCTE